MNTTQVISRRSYFKVPSKTRQNLGTRAPPGPASPRTVASNRWQSTFRVALRRISATFIKRISTWALGSLFLNTCSNRIGHCAASGVTSIGALTLRSVINGNTVCADARADFGNTHVRLGGRRLQILGVKAIKARWPGKPGHRHLSIRQSPSAFHENRPRALRALAFAHDAKTLGHFGICLEQAT